MSARLLLDAGNSRVKWRFLEDGQAVSSGVVEYAELAGVAPAAWAALHPERVVVSLVHLGDARRLLQRCCETLWGIHPEFAVSARRGYGVVNGYEDPATLGVDRWLALVAARALYAGDVVVVDAGTAMTVDWLDRDGVFRGGMIVPGRRVLESVFARRVPQLAAGTDQPVRFPAGNTVDAVALGIQSALVAALDRFIDNAASAGADEIRILLTGGDAGWLQALWQAPVSLCDNLVLDGLGIQSE